MSTGVASPSGNNGRSGGRTSSSLNPHQDVAWLNTRLKRGAARVHILKNPTRPILILGLEEGRADSHFPCSPRAPFVIETGMTDLQLLDQFVELPLDLGVICAGENALLAPLGNLAPVDAVQFRIVELLLASFDNLLENRVELVSRQ